MFVTTYKVVTFFGNHLVKCRNLVGRILEICVHSYNNIALCCFKTTEKRRTLSVISTKLDATHIFVFFAKLLNDFPTLVGRAIIYKNYFVREVVCIHYSANPSMQFRQTFFFVIEWYYNRYIHILIFSSVFLLFFITCHYSRYYKTNNCSKKNFVH